MCQFQVLAPNEFSDHAALYFSFSQPNPNRYCNTPNVNNSASENWIYWDSAKEPDFQSLLLDTTHNLEFINEINSPIHEKVCTSG